MNLIAVLKQIEDCRVKIFCQYMEFSERENSQITYKRELPKQSKTLDLLLPEGDVGPKGQVRAVLLRLDTLFLTLHFVVEPSYEEG